MNCFVIGVSGVTCGGKTTISKLLQRTFPWAKVIHQDQYFYPEDHPSHIRIPAIKNHINFDTPTALNMKQMTHDVKKVIQKLSYEQGNNYSNCNNNNVDETPNFEEGMELLRNLEDLDVDSSAYCRIPILIIEGFTIFESKELDEDCDIRFFLTLDEDTCRKRRSCRVFDPPDGEGYFDHCIWPEYEKHFKNHIDYYRKGIYVLSGKTQIGTLWENVVLHIIRKIEHKFPEYQIQVPKNKVITN